MVQRNKRERKETIEVIDTSLLIDGLIGITTLINTVEFPPASKSCKVLFPTRQDFKKALDIAWMLRKIGKPIGAVDILNASMCLNRDLKFITKDKDYRNIKLVEPKFKLKLVK
ncbi:MAG: type II toxin-antitoxin system VapC family toxin [Candidatus Aenigmarchaeota archaeon]|nr:type II toxin-antitoxin system VapC family toxin [Candidatus Aenigmarchaeota archaeon]